MRIRMTDERQERLRKLMQATGEATKSGAIDIACKHYLADLEAKERHVEQLPDDLVDALSTPYVPMEREVEESVGRDA